MARSVGIHPRRGHLIDAEQIIVGKVQAGARNRAAETRTGAARLLSTSLNEQYEFKAVVYGHGADAAGGYLLQAAHVPLGGDIADAVGWVTIAVLEADGKGIDEVGLTGLQIHAAVKESASLTTVPVRAVAVRAVAGTGSNGAAVPAGEITITLEPSKF